MSGKKIAKQKEELKVLIPDNKYKDFKTKYSFMLKENFLDICSLIDIKEALEVAERA